MGVKIALKLISDSVPDKNTQARKGTEYEYEDYTRQATGDPYSYNYLDFF